MISILSTAVNTILGLGISALKAFLSMLTWFLKLFFSLIKYLYCFLPVTAVVFCGLYCINTFLLFSGNVSSDKIAVDAIKNEQIEKTAQNFLQTGNSEVGYFYEELITWWKEEIGKYKGTMSFVFLIVLSFILLAPVVGVILGITVLVSYGKILFFAVAADMAFYIGYAILGKGFMSVVQNRFYKLFPDSGKRKIAREYAQWKKERECAEAEQQNYSREQNGAAFYEDDYYPDEDDDMIFRERYRERSGYNERCGRYGRYNEKRYDDREYDYRDYDDSEYEEEYEDEYYEDEPEEEYFSNEEDSQKNATGTGGFDFFAGCKNRESAERKYKSLVKLYHPDNMDGDNEALQEINVQYDKVKKQFS